ncbi:MAG: hypothetical protein BA863_12775 [Desulfovibrio sp. S3730MH75]|nr:MAG: hypothetical protein BA863_12775 [Desulfovibrio sp. S3730MH75]
MKNKYCLSVLLGMALTIPAASAFAAAVTVPFVDAVGSLTISPSASGAGGGNLTVDLSPGAQLSLASAKNEFALSTTSGNAQSKYRLEYGIYSPVTGYYQIANANDPDANGIVDMIWDGSLTVGTDPFGSFKYMGNSN